MKRGVLLLAGVMIGVACVAQGGAAAAEAQFPWRDAEVKVVSRALAGQEQSLCVGTNQTIHLKGREYTNTACVRGAGGETRVAFYLNGQGVRVAAIAFPTDVDFYDIRGLCVGAARCDYASKTDTFALPQGPIGFYTSMGIYSHFSEQLERFIDPGTMTAYYQFVPHASPVMIKRGSSNAAVNAFAFSENGHWAIAEVISYGFIRIDVASGQTRRVMAPGADYGYGFDPSYELAISDTGKEVAAVGRNVGIDIFEVDSQCGDTLTDTSDKYFSREVNPCRGVSVDRFQLFPTFLYATSPKFNISGTQLGITVTAQNYSRERAVLSPTSLASNISLAFMSLGDSFTSGEGETSNDHYLMGTDTEVHRCHVSDRSYPYLVGASWGTDVKSVACSGAQTNDIVGSGVYMGQGDRTKSLSESDRKSLETVGLRSFQPGIVRQLDFITTYTPSVVTVSIGGNDAGLMDKLRACLGVDVCEWVKDDSRRQATADEIKGIYGKLRQMIGNVRTMSPGSRVVLVGYPRVVNEAEEAHCSPLLNTLLKPEERRFMDESIKLLNMTLEMAARSEGVTYVNIQDALVGHRLCDRASDAMNDIRWGLDAAPIQALPQLKVIGSESFHPTPLGHSLVAQALLRALPLPPDKADCNNCAYGTVLPEESSYWKAESDVTGVQTPRQVKSSIVSEQAHRPGNVLSIATNPFVFRQGTTVVIELHSQNRQLGEIKVDGSGKVSAEATLPEETIDGFHTLHLFGTSWSGEVIDVYQVIEVRSQGYGTLPINGSDTADSINQKMKVSGVVIHAADSAKEGLYKGWSPTMPIASHNGTVLGSFSSLSGTAKLVVPPAAQEAHDVFFQAMANSFVLGGMGLMGLGLSFFWLIRRRQGIDKQV
ncbi:MAG TPA: SGNH/GDSL hydrolase family protein [Dongiaceae bacterium]|nr:SGNH/GDSL hydrolase family protein [Dongiaceae bacterium]